MVAVVALVPEVVRRPVVSASGAAARFAAVAVVVAGLAAADDAPWSRHTELSKSAVRERRIDRG